jgi:hypothetical protein
MPLTRTKKRMLIATLVVVGVVGALWSLPRKLDPRFFGLWRQWPNPDLVEYRRDGTIAVYESQIDRRHPSRIDRWWLEGDKLIRFKPTGSHWRDFVDVVKFQIATPFSGIPPYSFWVYEVEEVDSMLVLTRIGNVREVMEMTRMP